MFQSSPLSRRIMSLIGAVAGFVLCGQAASAQLFSATASHASVDAHLGIDGEVSFLSTWYSGTKQVPGMFFQIDMQQGRTISGLTLEIRKASIIQFPKSFHVKVSNDGSSWTTIVADQPGTPSEVTQISFAPTFARYVRVELASSANTWWAVSEMTVQRAPISRAGWTATASSNAPAAGFALDGAYSLVSSWNTGGPQAIGSWFMVDMKNPTTVSEVLMRHVPSSIFARHPEEFKVEVSNDGIAWLEVASSVAGDPAGESVAQFEPVTARFVRISVTALPPAPQDPNAPQLPAHWWWISEIEFYDL
jgi:hypothetical protein